MLNLSFIRNPYTSCRIPMGNNTGRCLVVKTFPDSRKGSERASLLSHSGVLLCFQLSSTSVRDKWEDLRLSFLQRRQSSPSSLPSSLLIIRQTRLEICVSVESEELAVCLLPSVRLLFHCPHSRLSSADWAFASPGCAPLHPFYCFPIRLILRILIPNWELRSQIYTLNY